MIQSIPNAVSVIIPTYCGAATLAEVVQRLVAVMQERTCQFEIILVEDVSPDAGATWRVVSDLARHYPEVRGLRLQQNRGQHNALLLGIREARYALTLTMDDDLQNPPEQVPLLLDKLEADNADVVYGVPHTKNHGLVQNLGSYIVRYTLAFIIGSEHARHVSAFRAFRTTIRDAFAKHHSPQVSIDALLHWGANKYSHVEVAHQPRKHGQSGYNLMKLANHALTMITHYSTMPLRISTITGFGLFLLGSAVSLYIVIGRLIGFVTEPGFTFIVSLFSIIGGAQLLALGIIGEYLATIFLRSLGMTAYTVAERTDTTIAKVGDNPA